MNPYGFVRLHGNPNEARKSVIGWGHDHFRPDGLSGRLECRLTALTHLFVPRYRAEGAGRSRTHEQLEFCRDRDTAIIPGTSLKGVLRSVAESVSNSCFLYPRLSFERNTVHYNLPPEFQVCSDLDHLCPACRLFGLLNGRHVFTGKVGVSDARAVAGTFEAERLTLAVLSAPKPRHRPFYAPPGQPNRPRGRKFYYHHAPNTVKTRTVKDGQNKTVEAARRDSVFTFGVEYTNLAADELGLLVYALALEPGMCHKVGNGKPVGLGSVHIEIVRWIELDRTARYRTLGGGWGPPLEKKPLAERVAVVTAHYRNSQAPNLEDFRRIWHWPPEPQTQIVYPSQQWFKQHSTSPLEGAP